MRLRHRLPLTALALALALSFCFCKRAAADEGMRVRGVIERIEKKKVESIFQGVPDRVVTRIGLKIERATDARGRKVDTANLVGLDFEGTPDLADKYKVGQRVDLVTTTPTGMHIATIQPAKGD